MGMGGAAFQGYAAGKSYTKVDPSKSSTTRNPHLK